MSVALEPRPAITRFLFLDELASLFISRDNNHDSDSSTFVRCFNIDLIWTWRRIIVVGEDFFALDSAL